MPLLFRHRSRSRCNDAAVCLASLGMGACLLFSSLVQASASHRRSVGEYLRASAIQRHLDAIPETKRTRSQYEHALDAYRAVYHADPASPDAPRSIAAVAGLLAGEGRCFHDAKLLHDAVAQWEFLRRQYPTSSLRQRALFEEAQIQQHDLHERAAARKSYRLFLAQYPRDSLADQARAGLHGETVAATSTFYKRVERPTRTLPAATLLTEAKPTPGEKNGVLSSDRNQENLLAHPPEMRHATLLPRATTLAKSLPSADVLQDVRYWAESGSTRLAIDLSDSVPYRAYSDQNGRRITIVFFGADAAKTLLGHRIAASQDDNLASMRVSMLTANQAALVVQLKQPVNFTSFALSNPSRLILDLHPALSTKFAQADSQIIQHGLTAAGPTISPQATISKTPQAQRVLRITNSAMDVDGTTPVAQPQSQAYPLEPATNVQHSMARVLGLRVRRIVIDAGHGGHDSGTIGPDGLEEKDIALDVALRLGHLLQQRLGAEVIYTRRTDRFVPLEERTAIANAARADLFLSIHANSSSDEDVRGVETYFLNFTTSPDAMAVAGRENADSNRSVYELSDLVRKITLSDKIDESREFAGDVQRHLYSGLLSGNPGMKNRGVKQAPFVVLIGAQMPSILAEISFLTNREDAAELSRPAYRERLAEALYRGVAEYVEGMSGVRIAKTIPAEALAAPAE
ncbi:MAG: N-acetylmuramoyl-L-alanine amidase [Acidobacteriaceae bacterium]